jgi:CBS domain-containing protein
MIINPKVCPLTATISCVRELFSDDHVHAALIKDGRRLVSVVEWGDLHRDLPDSAPAVSVGRLAGRTIAPDAPLPVVHRRMLAEGRRRLAVVDDRGDLIGLLCLKRSGLGFCSDIDIWDREAERSRMAAQPPG